MPEHDDEATGRLLTVAAIHHAAAHAADTMNQDLASAAQTMLEAWAEDGKVEGIMQLVVMKYAMEHGSAEDVAALHRWFASTTG
ncbi:hypothetical protein [Streptomyces griseosporeus]|uniref:hypothetical protein n=1 Tax=Streptomyces griseosporeus TaxID=1910 RepID=UPI0036FEF0FC